MPTKICLFLVSILMLLGLPVSASEKIELTKEQQEKLTKLIAGRVAGEPQKCISKQQSRDMVIINEQVLLFGTSRTAKTVYLTRTTNPCKDIKRHPIIFNKRAGPRLCSGDVGVIEDLAFGHIKGSCTMNEFVPLTKSK